jgi:(2Fe-2S) ferredoxin
MTQKAFRVYLCAGPHCSPRGGAALLRLLEEELWQRGLDDAVEVNAGGCQDHCDFGPNMLVWPGPVRYAQLDADAIRRIVAQHLAGGEPVTELLATPEMRRTGQ